MRQIFVNLKRFEVAYSAGGLCPIEDPIAWIESVISDSVELGLGAHDNLFLTYLLPEGLIPSAVKQLRVLPAEKTRMLAVGCQGVHWENIQLGKNFGAYTSSLPAAAAVGLGAKWAIIGHSEERRAKLQVMQSFHPGLESDAVLRLQANRAVDRLIQAEVDAALGSGLKVLLCVGETVEERGDGEFTEQQCRIESVLTSQLLVDLQSAQIALRDGRVVIGYEPIWAIGPGKIPPDQDYIQYVSGLIKRVITEQFQTDCAVVYGGGLKEGNAGMIASIVDIDGGLVALTRFSGDIGFFVEDLKGIVDKYLQAANHAVKS